MMRELGLFAGAGGGLLASSHLLGWRTVCAVEIDHYCQSVLRQRQLDGGLPHAFPIWDDIRTFDGNPWRGRVDVVSGGFPCQDISSAGRRAGLAGDRSGLWFEMLRVVGEVRPCFVFAENSPNLRTNGLQTVLEGLAELGFDVGWGVLGAWHVGAPHRRNRMWIVAAHPDRSREREFAEHAEMAGAPSARGDAPDADRERPQRGSPARGRVDSSGRGTAPDSGHASDAHDAALRLQQGRGGGEDGQGAAESRDTDWWGVHRFAGVDDGDADRMGRVKATGNAQVPAVAALAWSVLHRTVTL
jgi:DNA (cytosine-5)-methyltransferase 1